MVSHYLLAVIDVALEAIKFFNHAPITAISVSLLNFYALWCFVVVVYLHSGSPFSAALATPLSASSGIRQLSTSGCRLAGVDPREETIYTEEHWEMRQALNKLIEKEINPYVDEWEAAKSFPAHQVIKVDTPWTT